MPQRHCGSVRSRIDFGRRSSETWFVLTISTRALAANPCHMPLGDLALAGEPAAAGELYGRNSPCRSKRSVLRISLFQYKSQRGRSRSEIILLANPTVFVDSVSKVERTA